MPSRTQASLSSFEQVVRLQQLARAPGPTAGNDATTAGCHGLSHSHMLSYWPDVLHMEGRAERQGVPSATNHNQAIVINVLKQAI